MKRDLELIRTLMLKLESLPMNLGDNRVVTPYDSEMQVEGYDTNQINHHLDLIHEAGFIDNGRGSGPAFGFMFMGLTNKGHDFVDSVRSPEIWRRTKDIAAKAGGVSVSLMVEIAKAAGKAFLKDHLGLDLG